MDNDNSIMQKSPELETPHNVKVKPKPSEQTTKKASLSGFFSHAARSFKHTMYSCNNKMNECVIRANRISPFW